MKHLEDNLQESIIKYIRLKYPKIICYAIPNGGKRNVREAARLKRQGVVAGVPDLCIPHSYSKGLIRFNALYLELKIASGKLTANQLLMIERLKESGNRVEVIRSLDDAIKLLNEYFWI